MRLIRVYKPDDIGFIVGRVKNTPFRARIDDLVGCFSVFPPKVCFMVKPAGVLDLNPRFFFFFFCFIHTRF